MSAASTLSLYAFQPADFGDQYFVMAASRLDAIEAVRAHVQRRHAENSLAAWPDDPDARAEALAEALAEIDAYVNETKPGWSPPDEKPPRIECWGVGVVVQAEVC